MCGSVKIRGGYWPGGWRAKLISDDFIAAEFLL